MFLPFRSSSSASSSRRHHRRDRQGVIVVLTAILLIVLMAMLAFSIDVGYMLTAQTDLQRSVDAGALAGAGTIADGVTAADLAVRQFIVANPVGGRSIKNEEIEIETGHWDEDTKTFTPASVLPSAIRARVTVRELPHFFGRVFGHYQFDVTRESIAVYMPREIIVTLDYSGSMSDDSELRNANKIGKDEIVANLELMWTELGSPQYGNMQFEPVYISDNGVSQIKEALGLKNVPYPYPAGSWTDYINYVKKKKSYLSAAGYKKKYGYLTWINYLQEKRDQHYETPVLWSTSEQPITAVKDAVTIFLAYLQEVETDDRVGLSVYTDPANNGARLEVGLTRDFQQIEDISRQRQAGHYTGRTNIGAGLEKARIEMEDNARTGAFKMIVLMTDGVANEPGSTTNAKNYVRSEAAKCAANGFPVITISLGSNADTNLMQEVADMTGGVHFNIPGGGSVSDYEEPLKDAFREIAGHRPLKLVK